MWLKFNSINVYKAGARLSCSQQWWSTSVSKHKLATIKEREIEREWGCWLGLNGTDGQHSGYAFMADLGVDRTGVCPEGLVLGGGVLIPLELGSILLFRVHNDVAENQILPATFGNQRGGGVNDAWKSIGHFWLRVWSSLNTFWDMTEINFEFVTNFSIPTINLIQMKINSHKKSQNLKNPSNIPLKLISPIAESTVCHIIVALTWTTEPSLNLSRRFSSNLWPTSGWDPTFDILIIACVSFYQFGNHRTNAWGERHVIMIMSSCVRQVWSKKSRMTLSFEKYE